MLMQRTSFVSLSALAAGAFMLLMTSIPSSASAAQWSSPFEISGWIPYWRAATGTADVLPHLAQLKEINPFGYTVTEEGRLNVAAVLSQEPWTTLRAQAKQQNVRYIPTVMWSNPEAMHAVLCDAPKRQLLVRMIVDEVHVNGFDGIDIDFEGKTYETKQCFSSFLKELYTAMGDKWMQCTIEARTPVSDRYYGQDVPKDAGQYANDFAVINKNCDRVRFMTYDQQTVDQKREAEVKEPYAPVSDTKWVEKTIREALKSIPARKIVLGIPTYGYEWDVKTYANDEHTYDLLWSFNPQWGLDLAAKYNITPGRNAWGEMGFTYFPEGSALSLPRPQSPWPWNLIASAASALSTAQNTNLSYRMVTWSDAQAIQEKVALAKKLGIRGVAVFKMDGGEDPRIWEVLK
jgi:spore germination protein YaaH